MLTGMPPFRGKEPTKMDMFRAIVNQKLNLKPFDRYYENGSLIKDFLSKCLEKNPDKRPSANELLNHAWIKTMVEEEHILC